MYILSFYRRYESIDFYHVNAVSEDVILTTIHTVQTIFLAYVRSSAYIRDSVVTAQSACIMYIV